MQKLTAFIFSILLLTLVNVEAQRNGPGRGQSPLTGRGGGSPLGPSNNGSGNITTTNSPSAGYVLTTDGTIYYWGVNTALLTNLPPYALTNFHSVDATFNAGLAFNGPSTNNQIAYFNDDIVQPYANDAEFGGVSARRFLVSSNTFFTGRVTNSTTSGGGFWTADSVGFISLSDADNYILLSQPQGGIVSTLDLWSFQAAGIEVAAWSTNTSVINSNFWVKRTNLVGNLTFTGGTIPTNSLLGTGAASNAIPITIGSGLSLTAGTLTSSGGTGSTNPTAFTAGYVGVTNYFGLGYTNIGSNAVQYIDCMGPQLVRSFINGNTTLVLTNMPAWTNAQYGGKLRLQIRHGSGTVTLASLHPINFGRSFFIAQGETNLVDIEFNGAEVLGTLSHEPSEVNASYASVVEIDQNVGQAVVWNVTNRVTGNLSLVLTNPVSSRQLRINVIGEVSGGTDRTVTLIPNTGSFVVNMNTFAQSKTNQFVFTLTNKNFAEITVETARLNGTNLWKTSVNQASFE